MHKLQRELEKLVKTFGENATPVRKIVTVFIATTPFIIENISECIAEHRMSEAADLVHKVKSRYGYFGLSNLMDKLTLWEVALRSGEDFQSQDLLHELDESTDRIILYLQTTPYYPPESFQALPMTGKKVIVVENDVVNAAVFKLFIGEKGASVLLVRNYQEALTLALENMPDLIFIDVYEPLSNSLETIRTLRSGGIQCPIVTLSTLALDNERQELVEAGSSDILTKPASRESINKFLLKYLL